MVFAHAWPRAPDARSSIRAAPAAESACRPDRIVGSIVESIAGLRAERTGDRLSAKGPGRKDTRHEYGGLTPPGQVAVRRRIQACLRCQTSRNRYFRIHWAVRPEPEHRPLPCSSGRARLGLAIAKRVARRAVDRNRIRRIARETFRRRRHSMRPVDFVVLAKPPAAEADSRTLKLALEQLWLRFESP